MKHFVLGTAGHVDHGKTALITALTGVDTDRLKEEKERGITIELGFASLKLPSGGTIGIVDVPGHEKFIKNMVAGAAGIDLVLLVIAADEGIMPQTKEHLHICSLLGIQTGLVALTKIDLVEKEWLELVKSEISEFLQGSFLAGAPIVPVSAIKQEGMAELIKAIDVAVSRIPEKSDDGIFRLPVDRIFTMKGFGTVVTGTLVSDKIRTGEEIQILPQSITSRVRGIQVHNHPVEEACAGQRTAVNLQNVEKSSIERGDVLVRPHTVWPSQRLDVFFEYLAGNARKLKNRTLARLHTGTKEIIARIVLLDKDELLPGDKAFAQLVLAEKGVVVAGDHFVLRSYSPITTIGGGRIVDPLPLKHKRNIDKIISEMNILLHGDLPEKIIVALERVGFAGINMRGLAFRLGSSEKRIKELLAELFSHKKALLVDSEEATVISASSYNQLEEIIVRNLAAYHTKNPLQQGIAKGELKESAGPAISAKLFNLALRNLTKKETIVVDRDSVRLALHQVELAASGNSLRGKISEIYHEAGLNVPSLQEVMAQFKNDKTEAQSIIKLMLQEGALTKINEDLCFASDALNKLRDDYRALLLKEGKATPASFRELTGLSRKYLIPLMEYFDMAKLTIRVGDHRILREKVQPQ